MPRPLTPKQEAFAHKYVECGNAQEAYKYAYPTSQKWPITTLAPEASKALANPKIATRIQALQERSLKRVDVSADDIARVAWGIATDQEQQPGPRVSALALLAKRHPEYSEKHDINANVRLQALQAVANMTEEQLLRLAGGGDVG